MKTKLILFVFLLASPFLKAQSLNLQGKLTNVKDASTVSLIDGVTSKELVSAKSVAGSFSLQTKLEYPSLLILSIDGLTQKIPVFVGNENVSIDGDVQNPASLNITGSVNHDVYNVYMNSVAPGLGKLFSKNRNAYKYLDESIRKFPEGKNFTTILDNLGYTNTICKPLSFGICSIYCGVK